MPERYINTHVMHIRNILPIPVAASTRFSQTAAAFSPSPTEIQERVSAQAIEIADATEYKIYIVDGASGMVVSSWYDAATICSGGSCSVTPAVTLDADIYTWWLRARNPSGASPWSSAHSFQVQ